MVNSCFKCGRSSEKDKDVILLQVPIEGKDELWQMEFLDRLNMPHILDKEVYLCDRHFSLEDFEMKNSVLQLKETALPVRCEEELEEQMVIKPELIYFKSEAIEVAVDSISDTGETKDLVPLEPLVEYMNVYDETELTDPIKSEDIIAQAGSENIIIDTQYITEVNGTQEISVVTSEGNDLMEPVMPFFLTSAPMFTILDENNEVGETIILKIEETVEKKPPPPRKEVLEEFCNNLCKSLTDSVVSSYPCDICEASFGCLSCLKSHYETLHIFSVIRHYKCKFSQHVSKGLVCPVCDLIFPTRTETLDHYITHSVACEICGSGFDRQSHLLNHYKTVHSKGAEHQSQYECELCKITYQYSRSLTKHYRTFHRMILCHVCKGQFATLVELQQHELVHVEKLNVLPFACSKCDKAFPRISDIAVHIRQDHKREAATDLGDMETTPRTPKVEVKQQTPVQKKVKVKK